ncbi:hypothetical protein B0H17DRAFT_1199180 [Mycena rosella]|uniref:Uncharacterized protein n=1 Tax=Mycena rosella TaxID=1033263 RepID=A0AAD7DMB8_MYCRO|nr:hypothetical protein B0H17DRAFT_1199180 [Mycena rosella]
METNWDALALQFSHGVGANCVTTATCNFESPPFRTSIHGARDSDRRSMFLSSALPGDIDAHKLAIQRYSRCNSCKFCPPTTVLAANARTLRWEEHPDPPVRYGHTAESHDNIRAFPLGRSAITWVVAVSGRSGMGAKDLGKPAPDAGAIFAQGEVTVVVDEEKDEEAWALSKLLGGVLLVPSLDLSSTIPSARVPSGEHLGLWVAGYGGLVTLNLLFISLTLLYWA